MEQSGGRVLNILESVEDFVERAVEDAVAVVEFGGYDGMDENFSGGRGEGRFEPCNVPEVEEGSLGDVVGEVDRKNRRPSYSFVDLSTFWLFRSRRADHHRHTDPTQHRAAQGDRLRVRTHRQEGPPLSA